MLLLLVVKVIRQGHFLATKSCEILHLILAYIIGGSFSLIHERFVYDFGWFDEVGQVKKGAWSAVKKVKKEYLDLTVSEAVKDFL